MRFPVRFRVGANHLEHDAETLTISLERMIIVTETKLYAGEHLSLRIQFPALSDGSFYGINVAGDVICGDKLADGKLGYDIEIERNSFHIASEQSVVRSPDS